MNTFKDYLIEKIDLSEQIDKLMKISHTKLSREAVESIVALINKTVRDWNREKMLNVEEIKKIVINGIKNKVIDFE